METPLDSLREPLEQAVKGALNRNALNNRGTLASFKLPGIALSIVKVLLDMDSGLSKAQQLGSELGQQGLSADSVFAAQAAAVEVAAKLELVTDRIVLIRHVLDSFAALFTALLQADHAEIERQRVQMEQAFFSTVASQRQAEDALRSAIRELSTPIMPVAEGILVLPLVGSIDSHRASEINERLLEGIAAHQAEIVIIDITGVPLMDTSTANLLLMTTKAANLLGSQIILCGIGAEIAQTITHLGVDLTNLTTMANLQSSISYALELTGLAIKPL